MSTVTLVSLLHCLHHALSWSPALLLTPSAPAVDAFPPLVLDLLTQCLLARRGSSWALQSFRICSSPTETHLKFRKCSTCSSFIRCPKRPLRPGPGVWSTAKPTRWALAAELVSGAWSLRNPPVCLVGLPCGWLLPFSTFLIFIFFSLCSLFFSSHPKLLLYKKIRLHNQLYLPCKVGIKKL